MLKSQVEMLQGELGRVKVSDDTQSLDSNDPASRMEGRRLDRRLDADERNLRMIRPQGVNRRRHRRVAGYDNHLAVVLQQLRDILLRDLTNLIRRTIPIGAVPRIGNVDRLLVGTKSSKGLKDAESSKTRIKETHGGVVHDGLRRPS